MQLSRQKQPGLIRCCRNTGLLLVMMMLSACSNNNSLVTNFNEYQARLARVLETAPPESVKPANLSYPDLSLLKSNITPTTIRLTQFYTLQDCAVNSLIAERNTALGKIQLPSQRYLYERALLDGLKQCNDQAPTEDIKQALAQWITTKQQQLPLVWADMLQTSQEIRSAFSSNVGMAQGNEREQIQAITQSLTYLLALDSIGSPDGSALEGHLQNLKQYPLPAQLRKSFRWLGATLLHTTEWLNQYTQGLDCTSPRGEEKARYLGNIFRLFFVERIQPAVSELNRYHYALQPLLETLSTHPHLSPAFRQLVDKQLSEFNDYQAQMHAHITLWQQFFKRCDIAPG